MYLVLAITPLVVAATTAAYWRHAEPATVTVLLVGVLASLVRRHRRAWVVLVVLEGAVVVSFAFDSSNVVFVITDIASLALLLSPTMRRSVRARHYAQRSTSASDLSSGAAQRGPGHRAPQFRNVAGPATRSPLPLLVAAGLEQKRIIDQESAT